MNEQSPQTTEESNSTNKASQQQSPGHSRITRRIRFSNMPQKMLGDEGLSALKQRNWTFTGILLIGLSVISDLMQIFGPISKAGLVLSVIVAAILGIIVLRVPRGRATCAAPFVSSLLYVAMFATIIFFQSLDDATDQGLIAKHFPKASAIQRAIYEGIKGIEESQNKILSNQVDIRSELESLNEQFKRANPGADPSTVDAFLTSVERLTESSEARKQKALSDYEDGEEDRAFTDLASLAEDQTKVSQGNAQQAADIWTELGALAFFVNTDIALNAYRKAAQLTPDDLGVRDLLGILLIRSGDLDGAKTQYEYILQKSDFVGIFWQVVALNNFGMIHFIRGNLGLAEDNFKSSLDLSVTLGRKEGMAKNFGHLGILYKVRGDLDQAEDMFLKSLDIYEDLGRTGGMASNYSNLGAVYRTRGDLDQAKDMYLKSREIDEGPGSKVHNSNYYTHLGIAHSIHDDLDQAEDMFLESLKINKALGSKLDMAGDFGNLGVVNFSRDDIDQAKDMFLKSLEIYEDLGCKYGIAQVYNHLGVVYEHRGKLGQSLIMYHRSLEINEGLGIKEGMADNYANLGKHYSAERKPNQAEYLLLKSLEINEGLGRKIGMADDYHALGSVYLIRGDLNFDRIEDMFLKSLRINEALGRKKSMANNYWVLGIHYESLGEITNAMDSWKNAKALYTDIGAFKMVRQIQNKISELQEPKHD